MTMTMTGDCGGESSRGDDGDGGGGGKNGLRHQPTNQPTHSLARSLALMHWFTVMVAVPVIWSYPPLHPRRRLLALLTPSPLFTPTALFASSS